MEQDLTEHKVKFYDDEIISIMDENKKAYVAITPLCVNLGIDPATQRQKVQEDETFNPRAIPCLAQDGRIRQVLCLPIEEVEGWLFTISPKRADPDAKKKLIKYRKECVAVLHEYWTQGGALNPRITYSSDPAGLIEQTISRMIDKLKNPQMEFLDMKIKQTELIQKENDLLYSLCMRFPNTRSWAETCSRLNLSRLKDDEVDYSQHPFHLSDIFKEIGYSTKDSSTLAKQFGKLPHVKMLARGTKPQIFSGNPNPKEVNYYWLKDKPILVTYAQEWLKTKTKTKRAQQKSVFDLTWDPNFISYS